MPPTKYRKSTRSIKVFGNNSRCYCFAHFGTIRVYAVKVIAVSSMEQYILYRTAINDRDSSQICNFDLHMLNPCSGLITAFARIARFAKLSRALVEISQACRVRIVAYL